MKAVLVIIGLLTTTLSYADTVTGKVVAITAKKHGQFSFKLKMVGGAIKNFKLTNVNDSSDTATFAITTNTAYSTQRDVIVHVEDWDNSSQVSGSAGAIEFKN